MHSQENPERFEPVGVQQRSQLEGDKFFATSVRAEDRGGCSLPAGSFL